MIALCLAAASALYSATGVVFSLKKDFSSGRQKICLSEIVASENLSGRNAEKIGRYCQIELKAVRTTLTAKEIELHAWAAGVIPEKISGSQIVITKSASSEGEKKAVADSTQKIRRGSPVKLILQSENMRIARDAVVLMDAFPGETVDVRLQGMRKNLRAKLVDSTTAEMVRP